MGYEPHLEGGAVDLLLSRAALAESAQGEDVGKLEKEGTSESEASQKTDEDAGEDERDRPQQRFRADLHAEVGGLDR